MTMVIVHSQLWRRRGGNMRRETAPDTVSPLSKFRLDFVWTCTQNAYNFICLLDSLHNYNNISF